ncbi:MULTISPECIES: MFS transporter [unclassified Sphingobium]|uniref:MFS transporter n=1 Tax=unclassified Sphingobium TaxID=2611147 RepID=UPI00222499A0|nr:MULTISPECIES: MFS transporter [unclassified Sphingobium]MCW2411360.1 MFS family permease [Sphingobium sp. B8D3D]MCW2416348.1 MFS family permease [Sphingobium sp. B8D3A]
MATTPATGKYYPGWWVVAAGFIIFFFSFGGPTYSMSLLYNEVIAEFGWTRAEATGIYAWKGLTGALVAILVIGPAVQRFGLKPVFLTVLIIQALGFFTFLNVSSIATYFLAGFLIGLGQGAVLLCIKLMVARWFMRNVGFAGALALVGSSAGGVVFPIVIAALIPEIGWRMTYALIGVSILAVSVPLVLFVKQNPTEEDLLPETANAKGVLPSAEVAAATRAADIPMTYAELVRKPMFWGIMVGVLIIAGVDQGLFQNMQLYFVQEVGLTRETAAWLLSLTSAIGLASKFIAGKFFDVYSVKGIAAWYLLIAAMVLLAFQVSSLSTAIIFICALGLAHGGLVCEGPVLAKHVFGPRNMDKVLPIVTGCFALGSSIGPVTLAYIYDVNGHYVWGFALFAAMAFFAAFLLTFVRPLYRDRLRAATQTGVGEGVGMATPRAAAKPSAAL